MAFKIEMGDVVDQSVVCCLYANGFPFNLVRSPYWQDMVSTLCKSHVDYVIRGYEKAETTLLAKVLSFSDCCNSLQMY